MANFNFKKIFCGMFVLCSAALLMMAAFRADVPVRAAVLRVEGPGWEHSPQKTLVGTVSRYGDWPELMLLGGIGFLCARVSRNQKWQRVFIIAMIASTIAGGVTNSLRLTTGRTRPRVSPAAKQGWYGVCHEGKWLIGCAEFNSFPSGHTATAVAFATVIILASPGWGLLAIIGAVGIACSRMLLGAHHLSDLVAATMIAIGVAWLCWRWRPRRCSVKEILGRDKTSFLI